LPKRLAAFGCSTGVGAAKGLVFTSAVVGFGAKRLVFVSSFRSGYLLANIDGGAFMNSPDLGAGCEVARGSPPLNTESLAGAVGG